MRNIYVIDENELSSVLFEKTEKIPLELIVSKVTPG